MIVHAQCLDIQSINLKQKEIKMKLKDKIEIAIIMLGVILLTCVLMNTVADQFIHIIRLIK